MEREYHVTQGECGCGQFLPVFITEEAGYTTQQISPSGNKGGGGDRCFLLWRAEVE